VALGMHHSHTRTPPARTSMLQAAMLQAAMHG